MKNNCYFKRKYLYILGKLNNYNYDILYLGDFCSIQTTFAHNEAIRIIILNIFDITKIRKKFIE